MRKPTSSTTTTPSCCPTRKQGASGNKQNMVAKKPQRGLGVAELERIRLQEEEQEQRLLYHHLHQEQRLLHPHHQDSSAPFHLLSKKQPPLFSPPPHLHRRPPPFNPTFFSPHPNINNPTFFSPNPDLNNPNPNLNHPNPNFMPPLATSTAEEPPTIPTTPPTLTFLAVPPSPTMPFLSPSLPSNPNLNLVLATNSSEFMRSHISSSEAPPPSPCNPSLSSSLATTTKPHSASYNEHSLPNAMSMQKSLFANPNFSTLSVTSNPNITPNTHITNPNLKIIGNAQLWPNSISTFQSIPTSTTPIGLNTPIEHLFLALHSPSMVEIANDTIEPSLTHHAIVEEGFPCTTKASSYLDTFMYLATSPDIENPFSLTDSSPNLPHPPEKNISTMQDAKELELPSFQSLFLKTQQEKISSSDDDKQYLRCSLDLDLNNTQGDYDFTCDAKVNLRTKPMNSKDTFTFGCKTSSRDDFLKLGLPSTITEQWNHGCMQTKAFEHSDEHMKSSKMERCYDLYGEMMKEKMSKIDLELKLSLPSFGYQ